MMIRYLLLIAIFALSGLSALAQDFADDTITIYYENRNPAHLDLALMWENVCLESFIQRNPNLDVNNMPYGQPYKIPLNENCYQRNEYGWEVVNKTPRLKYYEHGEWLDKPYYSSDVVYINNDKSIEEIARLYGVCIDDLLAENILLQDFETVTDYTAHTTFDIFIPQGTLSCTPPVKPEKTPSKLVIVYPQYNQISPRYFAQTLNICAEEVAKTNTIDFRNFHPEIRLFLSHDIQPCYNEQGQRLRYYGEQGEKLSKPIYGDFPVYIARTGETMRMIAEQHDVCIIDLLRINGFLDMTVKSPVEVFIPPARPCPQDITTMQTFEGSAKKISFETNICEDVLMKLNPHLYYKKNHNAMHPTYNNLNFSPSSTSVNRWVIIPSEPSPCYQIYEPNKGEALYEIEQDLNVCYEEFLYTVDDWWFISGGKLNQDDLVIYIPLDSLPCYNDDGQRLYYPSEPISESPYYTDMKIYIFQQRDTVYSISQQFNVCVHDLLTTNPKLKDFIPIGFPIFIPDIRPCYDDETGKPLIYEDEDGQLLDDPQIAYQLIYYGDQPFGHISRYYNVCQNRIEDANQAKSDKEVSYLGWIIPTDRPPCFDADGNWIEYVCYTQPIDMAVDYRDSEDMITFDLDGTHCYDLANPETVVWYQNKPYKLIRNWDWDEILSSRAFTAWCYGVSLDEINTINAQEDVLELLPLYTRLILQPTRDCYVENPEILEKYSTIHTVQAGETLSSIARIYNKPYVFLAHANDLDGNNTIWAGQQLIIPEGLTWTDILMMAGCASCLGLWGMLIVLRKRRYDTKKKGIPKKREATD